MVTLKDEGAEKVFHGVTTTEELMRVTQQEVEI
jgi:type II secretory ATPase GspE/PulE/Tfp pilus assembly ATPase PilB-like protein